MKVRRALRPGLPWTVILAAALACRGAGEASPSPMDRPDEPVAARTSVSSGPPERWTVEVVAEYPHDPEAFTQGLLWHAGRLFESTGLYGRSTVRRVRLETGEVEEAVPLPAEQFGEGLARVGEELVQITWREGVAHRWTLADLEPRGTWDYAGEGWGLAFDGARLVMSDGTDVLTFRDPQTFRLTGSIAVFHEGRAETLLNELEIVEGSLYANVLGRDEIVRIDPTTGAVTAIVDASGLLDAGSRKPEQVLNGIAHRPETGTFLLTGKLWPKLFEVRFVRLAGSPARPQPAR